MINFNYLTDYQIVKEGIYVNWLHNVIQFEEYRVGELSYVFCSDSYLLDINQKYLNHDTYTDIITFDYTVGRELRGDIYISAERVIENAGLFKVSFEEELHRVMVHGVLHLMGYGDKCKEEILVMRNKELEYMNLFHVEQ